jgi:hypothetical protein
MTEDGKPYYSWRVFDQSPCGLFSEMREHRVPFFLTLHAHLIIEETLGVIGGKFLPQLFSKVILLFYDIVYGIVSGYSVKEISSFWRER